MWMRTAGFVVLCLTCAWAGGAFYQRATVTSMQTTECISPHRSFLEALSGTTEIHHEYCAEYILLSPTTVFRVQVSKSAPLLLPSEEVDFRTAKGALQLRRDDHQDTFEAKVVCMQLRSSKQESCAALDVVPTMTARNPQ